MDNGTCIIFVLFYVFRHYKRVRLFSKRNEMITDFRICHTLLKRAESNLSPDTSVELVNALVHRIKTFGGDIQLQQPLRYFDYYDRDIILAMIRLTNEVIDFLKSPFYRRHSSEIFTRLLILHNLPRALLDDSSGDSSVMQNFHITKQEALNYISASLGNEWLKKGKESIQMEEY